MIETRRLTQEDVQAILPIIRKSDIEECECVSGKSIEAILQGANETTEAYAGLTGRRVRALFGVNVVNACPLVWMVAADNFEQGESLKSILRVAKQYIIRFIGRYGVLTNWVCLKNRKAVRFLRFLGARIEKQQIDINGQMFARFYFGENDVFTGSGGYWITGGKRGQWRNWRQTGGRRQFSDRESECGKLSENGAGR